MANITFTEGSGLQDSIFGKSQEPIKMFLEKRGEAFEQTSMLPELFNMGSSNHWGEKFSTMTAMDGFQPRSCFWLFLQNALLNDLIDGG